MTAPPEGRVAVVAEKPSVARDIARVLGANSRGDGYLHGSGYIVTWAIGHLVSLAQPHEINPEWRQWRPNTLPMLPEQWPLVVYDKTKDQFETVRRILSSPKVAEIVCATDAGREGELIFRYIYEAAQCAKPVRRLWISSLTPDAIRRGFETLRPGGDYDALADAARGRSRADWLVGMNLSRAYSLAYDENLSVGRVQTPTLAMLVERELAIRKFVPEDYLEVLATFHPSAMPEDQTYQGTWADSKTLQPARLPADGEEARRIAERARTGQAAIESVEAQTQRMAPLPLYDLTELQRHANRLFGFSAQKTLDTAQALYERHKLISYPRTDSRHLSQDIAGTLPRVVKAIAAPYREHLAPGTGERPLGRRFVDDSKVTDHHAIIPTVTSPETAQLSPDEKKIYDLICRRLLAAWHDDHIWSVTTVITAIRNGEVGDWYHTSGSAVQQIGWKVLDLAPASRTKKDEQTEQKLPAGLAKGQYQQVVDVDILKKKTRAPKRFTEGTLLTAMETAGKTLDEKELSDAMKETGLGTPATRAAIIEVLLKREYISRNGKSLEATEKGIRLIEVVHPEVKSPAMTGQWEAYLHRIQKKSAELAPFLDGIERYVKEVVGKVGETPRIPKGEAPAVQAVPRMSPPAAASGVAAPSDSPGLTAANRSVPAAIVSPRVTGGGQIGGLAAGNMGSPTVHGGLQAVGGGRPAASGGLPAGSDKFLGAATDLTSLLQQAFGFSSFRANQEAVCRAVIAGQDVLLVMPTGAGKSLCYQLPGLARGGTTVVISPLIALMEDQAAKLRERGFVVERIHSGRNRAASRQVCIDFLNGRLQFLFIAPERLRVPGFPEMLAKRKPSLIAIDEAHCISQWGHDFRPDYRMLGQYLPTLRPAAVIALTATATPLVQDDIAEQLGLAQPSRFIHGFRRDNLAIEVVEVMPSRRADLTGELLAEPERRPAIVYTPTRAQATDLAHQLHREFPCQAYHAGLDAAHRQRVQEQFLSGEIEVMVATIAFGMGIDKADVRTIIHTALPGSLEQYYQEIGRAGRDGLPSRTILMQSYADRRTHDFFFERDYPDPSVLDAIFHRLGTELQPKDAVRRQVRMAEDDFDRALEKLWIHGGAVADFAENISRGHDHWRDSYSAQGEQKQQQLALMLRYAESSACRMSTLVRHFGDLADSQKPCGICDFCAPEQCIGQRFRPATPAERDTAVLVLSALRAGGARPTGKLHAGICPNGELTRDEFEEVLGSLARAGLVRLTESVFEKDGRSIPYRKAAVTEAAGDAEQLNLVIKTVAPSKVKGKPVKRKKRAAGKAPKTPNAPVDSGLEDKLRAWRMAEAKRRGVPAFRIFSDQALKAMAAGRPGTAAELLAIPGIGLQTVEKYGAALYRLIQG